MCMLREACSNYCRFSFLQKKPRYSSEPLRLMGFSRTTANLSWESIRFAHYSYIPTQSYKLMVQERTNTILEYSEHM